MGGGEVLDAAGKAGDEGDDGTEHADVARRPRAKPRLSVATDPGSRGPTGPATAATGGGSSSSSGGGKMNIFASLFRRPRVVVEPPAPAPAAPAVSDVKTGRERSLSTASRTSNASGGGGAPPPRPLSRSGAPPGASPLSAANIAVAGQGQGRSPPLRRPSECSTGAAAAAAATATAVFAPGGLSRPSSRMKLDGDTSSVWESESTTSRRSHTLRASSFALPLGGLPIVPGRHVRAPSLTTISASLKTALAGDGGGLGLGLGPGLRSAASSVSDFGVHARSPSPALLPSPAPTRDTWFSRGPRSNRGGGGGGSHSGRGVRRHSATSLTTASALDGDVDAASETTDLLLLGPGGLGGQSYVPLFATLEDALGQASPAIASVLALLQVGTPAHSYPHLIDL